MPTSHDVLRKFREAIDGQVIAPGDEDYDSARIVWNGTADKFPAVVAKCNSVSDIKTAIRFARDNDLLTALRSGGHSMSGQSTVDDGIIIDLSLMKGATVDPERRVAKVNGGAHLGELDRAAQEHGLACPVGVVSHTGVAGLALGGGMGRLQRKFGMTVDNILAVDVVTAEGELLHASADENPDLYWGMRGAGPNFGVVTSFDFKLHEYDGRLFRQTHVFPAGRASEVVGAIDEYLDTATNELFLSYSFGMAPSGDPYPAELSGHPVVTMAVMHFGKEPSAKKEFAQLAEMGGLVIQDYESRYLEIQTESDEALHWGIRCYAKSGFFEELPRNFAEMCLKALEERPAADGSAVNLGVWAWGGAIADESDDAMAFTGRSGKYWFAPTAFWTNASDDEALRAWGRSSMEYFAPFLSTGNYINDIVDTSDSVVRRAYGDSKYERLVELKRRFDPDNFFKLNQNIKP